MIYCDKFSLTWHFLHLGRDELDERKDRIACCTNRFYPDAAEAQPNLKKISLGLFNGEVYS